MTPYSLRARLLLWLLAATAVLGLIALIDTWREALRTAQSVSDRVLVGSALAIAERVTIDQYGGLEVDLPFSSLEMLASTAQDKVFYRVDGPVGSFLTGYADLPVVATNGSEPGFADGVFGAAPIRSATLVREVSTGEASIAFSVTVAESTRARAALARAILIRSALRLGLLILGVAVVVWVAVTLGLRPLVRLGDRIAERSQGDLRPVTADTPEEVEPLVTAINSFMARLETALDALRNFTGNASHQLRTPLAVVRTQLALIDRSANPDEANEAGQKAKEALERAERVLGQLLVLARVDASSGAAVLDRVDLAALAREVTAEWVPAALQADIDLGFEGLETATVQADAVLLAELMKNLISNAIAYAGRGAVVTVRVQDQGDMLWLDVEDNGPGLKPEARATAARARHGTARPLPSLPKGHGSGMGLGLAIAAEITALFGAEFHLDAPASGRGLLARIRFAKEVPAED